MARVVAVEGLVLVEEIAFCDLHGKKKRLKKDVEPVPGFEFLWKGDVGEQKVGGTGCLPGRCRYKCL